MSTLVRRLLSTLDAAKRRSGLNELEEETEIRQRLADIITFLYERHDEVTEQQVRFLRTLLERGD